MIEIVVEEKKEIVCLPLQEARKSYGLFLKNRKAMADHGTFLYIPQDANLHISNVTGQLHIATAKNTTVTITQTDSVDLSIDLAIDVNSHVQFYDTVLTPTQTHLRATLKKDSSFKYFYANDGANLTATVELLEENSSFLIQGLCMLSTESQSIIQILVDHAAPHCTSRQHIKMLLNDHSKSSFEGKIYVRQAAQKTEAYQLNNNLLLSPTASAHTKPNLEIFADDVKASHGATVAQLSEDELFYLRARGISTQEARKLLTYGFCQDSFPMNESLLAVMHKVLHA